MTPYNPTLPLNPFSNTDSMFGDSVAAIVRVEGYSLEDTQHNDFHSVHSIDAHRVVLLVVVEYPVDVPVHIEDVPLREILVEIHANIVAVPWLLPVVGSIVVQVVVRSYIPVAVEDVDCAARFETLPVAATTLVAAAAVAVVVVVDDVLVAVAALYVESHYGAG